jgi:putative DNA primase/helicase
MILLPSSLISELIPEYSALIHIETLMVKQPHFDANTLADLADPRGARFAMTSETEEGQRLSAGKLKRITQGMGKIKAIRKYENWITFPETHKLFVDANYLPEIRETDNAIWNRLHPIPFLVYFPKAKQDQDLISKLKAEAEGVLALMVAGAKDYYKSRAAYKGLEPPKIVKNALGSWRKEMDQIGRFFADCCNQAKDMDTPTDQVWCTTDALYRASRMVRGQWGDALEYERLRTANE